MQTANIRFTQADICYLSSGSGDGFYSSEFQSLLRGNSLYNATMPRQLAYGATITLKNHRTGGGYLHSHWHLYPEGIGARQQQVLGHMNIIYSIYKVKSLISNSDGLRHIYISTEEKHRDTLIG